MSENILSTSSLTKQYGGTIANNNITINIPRGEIIGFVGENGSGKTTLLRMLTGLVRPTSGTYQYDKPHTNIGAIVEKPSYFAGMSGRENMLYHARLCGCDEGEALKILETVGLSTSDKKKVKNYSLGMRQRLGIGIALLGNPEFLILDEPTNGLDPQGIVEMRKFLESLVYENEITILISSHLLSELSQLATYYIFISHGKVVESIAAQDLHSRLGKIMTLTTNDEIGDLLQSLQDAGTIRGFMRNDTEWTLNGPFNYNELSKALVKIDLKELSTNYDSLETYYLRLTGGAQ